MEHDLKPEAASKDIVVFELVSGKDSVCLGCQEELGKGCFLTVEDGNGLCMKCADLDHLVFLPSGDAALSRRSKKYSKLWAVVVKFSRARRRYERQGLLVEEEALDRAEKECAADEDVRETRREYEAERRSEQDKVLAEQMRTRLMELFPGCKEKDAIAIARHTSQRGSGRVGRSEAGRNLDEEALSLAAVAYVRHQYTKYDELLMRGMPRGLARSHVRDKIEDVLSRWRQ